MKEKKGLGSIKKKLQIDVDSLNSRVYKGKSPEEMIETLEHDNESSSHADKNKTIDSPSSLFRELNVDISQMRIALGSEQTLREQSHRTFSQQVSPVK